MCLLSSDTPINYEFLKSTGNRRILQITVVGEHVLLLLYGETVGLLIVLLSYLIKVHGKVKDMTIAGTAFCQHFVA